jgi:RND family efflux transporter MFP subunit
LKVIEAKAQSVTGEVTMTGIFDTENNSIITSQLPGKVTNVTIKEGAQVHKGNALIVLDQSEYETQLTKANLGVQQAQASVDQAKLAYDNAQKNFEQVEVLYKAGASSQKDLDQITIARDNAKIAYETALNVSLPSAQQNVIAVQQTLAKTTIVSPIDGIVASLSVNTGDNVNPGVPLVTLISTEKLELNGNVSEGVINTLQIGQDVSVNSDRGTELAGKVSYISPVSIPTGQFFPVKIALDHSSPDLKPGMTANALIHVKDSSSLAVPSTAVIRRDGRNYVYTVKEGKVVKNPVQVGLQGEKLTEIRQGITSGEWVLVDGDQNVYEGMPAESLDKVENQ